jgi:opacity protein-like surface antigen
MNAIALFRPLADAPPRALPQLAAAALLAAAPLFAQAADGITDPLGDFLPTFAGSTASGDLDVLSASVLFNPGNDTFILSATLNGAPGTTAAGFYVWGVDRGAGTAGFAANGVGGVLFDRVILVRPDGTGSVAGAGNLAPGSISVVGNTITAIVPGSLLPSTGRQESQYTWNLWPRDGAFSGFVAISDFAPDNSNFAAAPIPEPQTLALMLAGLAAVGLAARRRRR